jgi:Holliday junction resolvasome RuvABC endonuclease subunit
MRLLALDQASNISGYAIFEDGKLLKYNKINLTDYDLADKLVLLRKQIANLIQEWNIDEVIIEDIQLQGNVTNNVKTFKVLAEVFGVIYELVNEMNIKNSAVLASEWKSTLKIKGRDRTAQKRAAQQYVIDNYNIKPTQDECDAICIGAHYYLKDKQEFDWSD